MARKYADPKTLPDEIVLTWRDGAYYVSEPNFLQEGESIRLRLAALHDSAPDTLKHISRVQHYLDEIAHQLFHRGSIHDKSKLEEPEKSVFDEYTNKLKHTDYDSPEYKGFLEAMAPALKHHYSVNSHHPEHYSNGVSGMSLMDVVEMLCDWKAATERTKNGDIRKSIEINAERFGLSEQVKSILLNTVYDLGWS
jgi:hypothetical protein